MSGGAVVRLKFLTLVDGETAGVDRVEALATVARADDTHVDVVSVGIADAQRVAEPQGMGRLEAEGALVLAGAAAQDEGYDGVVIDVPWDPAVDALRSRLGIPVVGSGGATLALAALLGGRAAMVVRSVAARDAVRRMVVMRGMTSVLPSVAVMPTTSDPASWLAEWASARARDGGGVLVLGDPGLERHAVATQAGCGLPVLAPGAIALKLAEALVDLGLSHSREAWLAPADDLRATLAGRLAAHVEVAESLPAPAATPPPFRVKVVVPISGMSAADLSLRADALAPGILHPATRVAYHGVSDSSNSADCQFDSFILDLFCAEEELRADAEGYDAVLVDSTTDSGIAAVRPHIRALALGPGEACWSLAAVLGNHFTILSMERKWQHFYLKNLALTGFLHQLTSIEDIGTAPDPVRLFEGKESHMNAKLVEAARRGVDKGADTIVIGSTTMHQALAALEVAFPVPVLSPGRVGVRMAELLLDMGLRHVESSVSVGSERPDRLFNPATRTQPAVVEG
jgi:allantoin racemase